MTALAAVVSSVVIGIVGSGAQTKLVHLDARTLTQVGPAVPIRTDVVNATPSLNGKRVALGPSNGLLVVDLARRRIVEREDGADATRGVVWTSQSFTVVGWSKYGYEYSDGSGGATDTDAWPVAILQEGLVVSDHTGAMILEGQGERGIHLPQMPDTEFAVAADVAADRLFVVSTAGIVGEVDRVGGTPRVTYHTVSLNGRGFHAVWAGAGRIALWGADGLGLIDTRDWSTHAVAADVTAVARTSYGLLATGNDGLALYRPTGALAFRRLHGHSVGSVVAIGRYAYAETDAGRFSIDLSSGRLTGPLASRARIVQSSLDAPLPG
jgi:hypothetical protein